MHSEYTLESLCSDLRRGTVSAAEIRQRALNIEAKNSQLNCFIRSSGDAEEHFAEADDSQKGAPLYGIPVSFKDNICVAGLPVTVGTQGMADCIATHDAVIVRKLKSLGAVVAGKNNMNELCFGVTSIEPYWGAVENPSAPGYSVGGSSSGCAAAVAAGIVPIAIGTDTGGSARIPASFCGITGFRPTSGHWSSSGIIPISHTKDSPGLMTRTASDAHFLYTQLSSDDVSTAEQGTFPCRIGLPLSMWSELDDDVMTHCRHAINQLVLAGFECVDVDDAAVFSLNQTITFTLPIYEFFIDFPRTLLSLGWENRITAVFDNISDKNVRNIIHEYLGGGRISPADYVSAVRNIGRLRLDMDTLFSTYGIDMLVYPTVPRQVPPLSQTGRPELFAELIRNTDLASNAAMPSVTLPVAPEGALPVGLSFDASRGRDGYLLSMAARIETIIKP
ncbi:Mandelamide hydrolase [Dickeya dianthicola]|uniref:Amidase n=1 Tax=Dickeya dianthicola TaxID=204039 RepID=A0ABX9NU34_9GAMM|nr:amidase family protein [Dickeya dianthicola]ATO31312.1 Indoleacetamide hydrolase [Dickeya dianthicola RNS04.9]AYC17305.1 Mandelamide hydrolase [Dickeya dianthicola]MBI0436237.1 amidase [Dickeya dianthicola]MBI0450132.1 amidase [Dickeya dianthicola]MBI0454789.1 amidase [Dickeya dianthicola]